MQGLCLSPVPTQGFPTIPWTQLQGGQDDHPNYIY